MPIQLPQPGEQAWLETDSGLRYRIHITRNEVQATAVIPHMGVDGNPTYWQPPEQLQGHLHYVVLPMVSGGYAEELRQSSSSQAALNEQLFRTPIIIQETLSSGYQGRSWEDAATSQDMDVRWDDASKRWVGRGMALDLARGLDEEIRKRNELEAAPDIGDRWEQLL